MTHWHVINGLSGGYMPDGDGPMTFDTRAEATRYARDEASEERWQRNDATRYTLGSVPRRERWVAYLSVGHSGPFIVTIDRPSNPYSLPYYWEGIPCECSEDDDDA